MVNDILTAVALPHRAGRFPDPPATPYVVYFDAVEADGPDDMVMILHHDATVELYSLTPAAAAEAEAALEAELKNRGLHWTKQDRYWLGQAQRYQTIYEFTYIEKI